MIREVRASEAVVEWLMDASEDWEKENSCWGYRKNTLEDIQGNRIFLAMDGDSPVGYLFGHCVVTEKATSVYPAGTTVFEVEELYVKPGFRNRGIGKALFQHVEKTVSAEAEMLMLATATKNFRAILHFYIDELGMSFWSACLFKRIGRNPMEDDGFAHHGA